MKRLLLLLGLLGGLVASCRPDDLLDCSPTTVTAASLRDFSRRNGVPTQIFTPILSSTAQAYGFSTQGGATLTVPQSTWRLPNGAVALGPAQVRVREIYSVADMVLSDMTTDQPNSQPMLVSGGEFNIQVYAAGQRLRLTNGTVQVTSPVPPNQDTTRQLVWNQPGIRTSVTGGVIADSTGWVRTGAPAVQQVAGYYRAFLPLDSVGWWNIDQYWSRYYSTPQIPVLVATPANSAADTRVYLRPSGVNGLTRLHSTTAANDTWTRFMPLGTSQLAIVLQLRNGQLYYGTQAFVVQTGVTIRPPLTPVTEAQAVQLIRQL